MKLFSHLRFGRVTLLVLLGGGFVSFTRADLKYTAVDLGSVVSGADAIDINNPGDVVINAGGHTYLYKGGTAYQIPENFGLTHLSGVALNDHDQIIGTGTTAGGLKETFQYDFGTSTGSITNYIPQDDFDQLLSINNLGMTSVGQYTGTQYIHQVFDASGHNILPASLNAYGLNNAGDVWVDEQYTYNLITGETSNSDGGIMNSGVFGDNGWWAHSTPSSLVRGKLGNNPVPAQDLGTVFPELFSYDINGNGDVVGSIWKYPELYPYHAFLANDGGIVDLNDVAPLLAGNFYAQGERINDAGEIIGFLGSQDQVDSGAFLLIPIGTPVPEASTMAWAASGLALLGAIAWRRRRVV